MQSRRRVARLAVTVVVVVSTALASGESRKESRFSVGRKAAISVFNQYGTISVKPGDRGHVVITAVLYSDKVETNQNQTGSRVDVVSQLKAGADQESGRVDYEIVVPPHASVTLQSSTGSIRVEGLRGDVNLESAAGGVNVHEIMGGHLRVRTLNGPITLAAIQDSHVEVTSVSGDVAMTSVDGPFVQVNSNSGKISYDGPFGAGGEYNLVSHTGDIEAIAPSYASFDVVARSEHGTVENDFSLQPRNPSFVSKAGSAFAGTLGKAASSVKLFSISGKIHLKKR